MIPASAPQAQAPCASEEPPAVANDTAPPPAAALEPSNADDCPPPQPSAPEAQPLDATQLEVSSVDASSVAPSVLDAAPIEVVSFEITENHEPLPATNLAASNAAAAIAGATPSPCASIPLQEQAPARANSSYSNNSNSSASSIATDSHSTSNTAAAVQDTVDADLFPIFCEEAETLTQQLYATMRQWSSHPENTSASKELMRLLHTYKGGARLAGAMHLGSMAHEMESAIGAMSTQAPAAQQIELLQEMLDEMDNHFRRLLAGEQACPQATQPLPAQAEPPAPPVMPPVPAAAAASTPATSAPAVASSSAPADADTSQTAPSLGTAQRPAGHTHQPATVAAPAATHLAAQPGSQQQVRVRSQILDRMLGQTGEVASSRARLESGITQFRSAMKEMSGNLEHLRAQLRDMELQAEAQMQSRHAQASDATHNFDPLEFDRFTRVQELTRIMAESVNDIASVQRSMVRVVQSAEDNLTAQARQTRELQNDLLRTRMVEFDSLSERLHRVVRQTAKESGKQVALEVVGGHIEIDRSIIERITSPFEHLLRNAIVHGIESAQQRQSIGKTATGQITIALYQEGNDVAITVRDDGRGLDVARIREKAITQGLLQTDSPLSDEQATQLIFKSGLTTADQVTSLAGRGVGMDVVRSEINALGGYIKAETWQHIGTEFTLVVPLTTAITQVVEMRAGELHFGVPAHLIESVQRCSGKEIEQAYNTQTYTFNGQALPFYWSGAMLQASRRSQDTGSKRQVVVVLRNALQRIVMHISEITGNHEVIVKNVGPQLARLPGLAGITILPNGQMLSIYNPIVLSVIYAEQIRTFSADYADPATLGSATPSNATHSTASITTVTEAKPLILVVDDSITVRRVTERLLKRKGYRVALAADGLAALRELEIEKPAVMLSDIEMPRMDGFELVRNVRHDEAFKNLPIIMITSRSADKHREHALQLGANDFLGKPYSEERLLDCIRQQMCAQAVNTSAH